MLKCLSIQIHVLLPTNHFHLSIDMCHKSVCIIKTVNARQSSFSNKKKCIALIYIMGEMLKCVIENICANIDCIQISCV